MSVSINACGSTGSAVSGTSLPYPGLATVAGLSCSPGSTPALASVWGLTAKLCSTLRITPEVRVGNTS